MLVSCQPEIENARLNQLFYATRMSLGIAWKLAVSAIALAIFLGMVAGPAEHSEKTFQPVRVERKDNRYRILTQLPEGGDTLQLELIDPLGKKHLYLAYGKEGIVNAFTQNPDLMHVAYMITRGCDEVVNIRTPGAYYSIRLQPTGESSVNVEAATKERTRLGQIRISPEGEPLPNDNDVDLQIKTSR